MHLLCPHCQQPITVPETAAGQSVECRLCGKPFRAPATSLYAPQAAAGSPAAPPAQPADPDDDREPYGLVTPPAPNRAALPRPEPPRPEPPAASRSDVAEPPVPPSTG